MNLAKLQAVQLDQEERMVLKFRKHWFVLLRDEFGTLLAAFVPAIALTLAVVLGFSESVALPSAVLSFLHFWWLLIVWLALTVIWTNYYLDLWVVTDKRLISIDQTGLFRRTMTVLPVANVQDVTVEQSGVLQTLLNFGTIRVQTAGPTTRNLAMHGIARPAHVRDQLVKQCEAWRARGTAAFSPSVSSTTS